RGLAQQQPACGPAGAKFHENFAIGPDERFDLDAAASVDQAVPHVVHADHDGHDVRRRIDHVALPARLQVGDLVSADALVDDERRIGGIAGAEPVADAADVAAADALGGVLTPARIGDAVADEQ